jgi:hypothetical protein
MTLMQRILEQAERLRLGEITERDYYVWWCNGR